MMYIRTFLICYDIHDKTRLRRVHRTVRDFGVAIQFSVFKAELDQKRLEQLMTLLKPLINPRVDSINFYPMNAKETLYLGVHPLSDTVGIF